MTVWFVPGMVVATGVADAVSPDTGTSGVLTPPETSLVAGADG